MKSSFSAIVAILLLASCASKEKTNEPAAASAATEPTAPTLAPLEAAQVTFVSLKKEIAKLRLVDTDSGLKAVFETEKLSQGDFVLQIEESCGSVRSAKNQLPPKYNKVMLGEFYTSSGHTSSEFSRQGLSVGERFSSVSGKAVSLSQKSKKGKLSRIACDSITKI